MVRAPFRGTPAEGHAMPNRFAILRVEKVKSFGELRGRSKHNSRDTQIGIEHCRPENPPELLMGRDDASTAWDTLTKKAGLSRDQVRKNGTVALEWMATASPEWFAQASPEEVAIWAHTSVDFIAKRAGGKFTVLSAHLHLDETTPHLQIITCPLVKKAVKKRGRKSKDAGDEPDPPETWRLSAKDIIGGDRDRLTVLQDDYAAAMKPLGLERGIPRKETGARNKPPSKYRAELARRGDELDAREAHLTSIEADLSRRATILSTVRRQMGQKPDPDLESIVPEKRKPPQKIAIESR